MSDTNFKGRVTIPTDVDVVPETLELVKRWGADAIRDCDGTDYPEELKNVDAKVYSTYYTTRKDNAWAKSQPGGNPADVHYDAFLHSCGKRIVHSSDEPFIPGYAEGKFPR